MSSKSKVVAFADRSTQHRARARGESGMRRCREDIRVWEAARGWDLDTEGGSSSEG